MSKKIKIIKENANVTVDVEKSATKIKCQLKINNVRIFNFSADLSLKKNN